MNVETLPQSNGDDTFSEPWDYKGRPARRSTTGGWIGAAMILGLTLSTLGTAVNLVTYLTGVMHLGNAATANAVANFMGTSFMLCLLGGFIADQPKKKSFRSVPSMKMNTHLPNHLPAASEIAGSLDLLVEILSRVPARSLFRFKCVCRQWRRLISDDHRFALLHTMRNPSPSCSGLFSSSLASVSAGKEKKFDFFWIGDRRRIVPPPPALSFLESFPCSRILQSCNGLLLCSSSHSDFAYFVCNPALRCFSEINLPDEIARERNRQVLDLTLVFDASRWSGFKVICAWSRAIDAYSSATGHWERLAEGPIQDLEEGVYWNGKVIWLRKPPDNFLAPSPFDSDSDFVIFDFEGETWSALKLPSNCSMVCYFGESMGHLQLVTKNSESFNLFEMGEDMNWVLKFRMLENVMRTYLNGGYWAICSSIWDGSWILNVVRTEEQGEGEEDGYHVLWYLPSGAGRVISYNCKTNLISCLSECNPGKTFHFIESLYWI